jgi:hypothetical protein
MLGRVWNTILSSKFTLSTPGFGRSTQCSGGGFLVRSDSTLADLHVVLQIGFEVIVGKSMAENGPSRCFGFVQTYDKKPKRSLFELLKRQGMQMNQRVMFFSDGGHRHP